MLAEARAIASRPGKSTAQTLLAIFEVLCRDTLEQASRANRVELLDVSSGIKSSAESLQEYRTKMSLAIRIICARKPAAGRHGGAGS